MGQAMPLKISYIYSAPPYGMYNTTFENPSFIPLPISIYRKKH